MVFVMSRLVAFLFIGGVICQIEHSRLLQELSTDRVRPASYSSSEHTDLTAGTLSLQSLPALAELGKGSGFRYANGQIQKSAKGTSRVRLIQTYGGYDVFGSSVEAELDSMGRFTGQMYGVVIKNLHYYIPDPEACQQKVVHLQNRATKLENLSLSDPGIENRDGRRLIFDATGIDRAKLVYKIQFFLKSGNQFSYPVYFFDACTGDVLFSYDRLMTTFPKSKPSYFENKPRYPEYRSNTSSIDKEVSPCPVSAIGDGGNEKMGKRLYNTPPYCLNVKENSGQCEMDGTHNYCVDNENSDSRTKTTVIEFTCNNGYKDNINGAYGVANDAFFHGEILEDFLKTKYELDVLNYKPRQVVHFGNALENAFCDGTDTYYGDGDTFFYPLVTIDVVIHELAHAITSKHSDLVYRGMSGGMNEAFSDISAVAGRAYFKGTENPDWKLAANVVKSREALRYLNDPPLDGSSIKSIFRYRWNMGVHQSSGIFNYAFYRMVGVEGMDIFEAYKCFLDANMMLWSSRSNFFSGACNVVQAAYDNGYDHRKVRRAFRRTGIPLIFCNHAALSTTIFVGESRENILVSATRSPIFRLEIDQRLSNFTMVEAVAANSVKIKILVAKDNEASKIITGGNNAVRFGNYFSHVYVQLVTDSRSDIQVQMNVFK